MLRRRAPPHRQELALPDLALISCSELFDSSGDCVQGNMRNTRRNRLLRRSKTNIPPYTLLSSSQCSKFMGLCCCPKPTISQPDISRSSSSAKRGHEPHRNTSLLAQEPFSLVRKRRSRSFEHRPCPSATFPLSLWQRTLSHYKPCSILARSSLLPVRTHPHSIVGSRCSVLAQGFPSQADFDPAAYRVTHHGSYSPSKRQLHTSVITY
jgi:hypothetical protein